VLQEIKMPTSGRKAELVSRLMEADPEGKWMENASAKENTEGEAENEDSNMTKRELEILE